MKRFIVASAVTALFVTGTASAKTLMLEGRLNSSIAMRQQMEFSIDQGTVQTFTFRFALPADFQGKSVSQSIDSLSARFQPEPSSSSVEQDRFGNRFQKVVWSNAARDIRINLNYTAAIHSELSAMQSTTPFPIGQVTGGDALYLTATEMAQSDSPEIVELARRLTTSSKNEYEAVTAITNHVTDSIKYTFNPPKYDALYTLQTKSGNCQNFAHLNIALLRSVGIPARIVGGITLKDAWKVPIDARNSIVQSMGQGGHAWMEIYFPDLGWLPYDPQQSRQFTSSRHIKQTHGLDSRDINDTWRGAPYLPRYSELIEGSFTTDDIKLKVRSSVKDPRPYIISNLMAAESEDAVLPPAKQAKPPLKPVAPKIDVVKADKPPKKHRKPATGTPIRFGNMDFPTLVSGYNVQGNIGTRILDKETSEYVTSHYIYAQAFTVKDAMTLDKVSLAMRKFGGDGSVYVDVVRDDQGKPGLPGQVEGVRSNFIDLEKITRKPGYYWVDFSLPTKFNLKQGKYWIVLRSSGEAIMNWFYIPGKPYSDGDDTRSTAKGFQWEDILNYDFVFKVTGKAL
jgi:transglutaminase-like putative cysteine protease